MAHLLICDDEAGLRTVIRRYANFEGHSVSEAMDGEEAVALCQKESFDLILLDVMMPRMDGFTALGHIREHSDTPVMMLSARGEEYDKVLAFELGVDDYVLKPFSSKELMLRIGAILRRIKSPSPTALPSEAAHVCYEQGGFLADLTAYKVFIDGQPATLAPKAYDLLFFLLRNRNIAVPRERILTEVWGFDYCGDDRTLDTHMKLLRKALGPYGGLITTLRGLGYRFDG